MSTLVKELKIFIKYAGPVLLKRGKAVLERLSDEDVAYVNAEEFSMQVPSSDGEDIYETGISYSPRTFRITGTCTCPYASEYDDYCKHQVAVAKRWLNILEKNNETSKDGKGLVISINRNINVLPASYDFPFIKLDFLNLNKYALGFSLNQGYGLMYHYQTRYEELVEEKSWKAYFGTKKEARVTYKDESSLTVACNCGKLREVELCEHALALLLFIGNKVSHTYFYRFKDYSEDKKRLLQQFGLKPGDPLSQEFKFDINEDGKLVISDRPSCLLGSDQTTDWNKISEMLSKPKKAIDPGKLQIPVIKDNYETGVLLNFNSARTGGINIEPVMVFDKKGNKSFRRISLTEEQNISLLFGLPAQVVGILKKITDHGLTAYLVSKGYGYLKLQPNPFSQMQENERELIRDRMYETMMELKPYLPAIKELFHLREGEKFANKNITPAVISDLTPSLHFKLSKDNQFLRLHGNVIMNNNLFPLQEFERVHFFLRNGNEYFLLRKEDLPTLEIFRDGMLMVHESEQVSFLNNVVKPLAEKYSLDFADVIQSEFVDSEPQGKVYLSELNENFLLIKLKWEYGGMEVEEWEELQTIVEKENTIYKIIRKKEEERVLIDTVRGLHARFSWQANEYFYLNFSEALHNNWFLVFYNKLLELNIPVYGINNLKKFRYNPNKPSFSMRSSSKMDWFDLSIQVTYGDIVVPLQELRKAIINRQNYVLLSDGSLGMLPNEWIEKYALLMKMGELKEGKLKVSKFNWTVLNDLQQDMQDKNLQKELEEKTKRLQSIGQSPVYPVPSKVTANMRDYQVAGFQWMCLLDDMLWGGCLADDMGLGKTLQTIAFLQHIVDKYPRETHLVVCPTSLIYNWQNELEKFAPELSYYIHYGTGREFDKDLFIGKHIIVTSYGVVRNDIKHFSDYSFGYVILDESQTIKNPVSQTTRAVQLLKARNRFVLSGTPVQNNTFDLYAQMHFLNPGMLGNQEFFKNEFANPIDKNGDKEKSSRLRQLIYPFLLRRTKEQVAGDLPDKTEMTLWCEMGAEQRKIYNSFRDHYRKSILERIAGEGMNKSSIHILQGLTKLRQICDSPAILNEEENYPNVSAKLEELTREIEENTGRHKALVFSQFVTMLKLVEESLGHHGISFLYLDGSSPAAERKKIVQQFQEDDTIRVFLISLKAGGVGLNLTSADYVYLIDPWWNPATEQQAIDRTHRLGQRNKVFAYKMICKDSVEEKILELQAKKKDLAADLIGNEGGFIKKLTKEDVAYLFS